MLACCCNADPELRQMVLGNGSVQVKYQCKACGKALSSALKQAGLKDIDKLPHWDRDRETECHAAAREAQHADFRRQHDAYLETPQWRSLRMRVMDRAQGRCEGCRTAAAVMVHHLTYAHWQRELLWELVAVCAKCHAATHE